jgi:hypothetical protein
MRRKVDRKNVEDDVQSTVGVQIEVANETNNLFPHWTGTILY